jgi:threonine dehydrogenase-like Zn-dependent dehydrogenase
VKALVFHFELPRLAMAKALGTLSDGGFLSGLGPVRYQDVPEPALLGDDWVIVETRYAGICGSDVKQVFLEGATDNPITSLISFPHVMGHEMVGTVVDVGRAVTRVKRGDRVACYPWLSCLVRGLPECRACREGRLTSCESFAAGALAPGMHAGNCRDVSGGFAPLLPAHESTVFPIPERVSFDVAALADPFAVSLHTVLKAPPADGETVLVLGCGTLGLLLVHAVSRLYPAATIVAVDVHEHVRSLAETLGAHHFYTERGAALVERIGALTGCVPHAPLSGLPWLLGGVDKIYDTVGAAPTLELGVRVLRPQGRLVMVGVAPPARFEWTPLYFKELELVGSNGCGLESWNGERVHAFELFLSLLVEERIDPAPLLTHRYPLEDYKEAFVVAKDKGRHRSVKVLFDFAR